MAARSPARQEVLDHRHELRQPGDPRREPRLHDDDVGRGDTPDGRDDRPDLAGQAVELGRRHAAGGQQLLQRCARHARVRQAADVLVEHDRVGDEVAEHPPHGLHDGDLAAHLGRPARRGRPRCPTARSTAARRRRRRATRRGPIPAPSRVADGARTDESGGQPRRVLSPDHGSDGTTVPGLGRYG